MHEPLWRKFLCWGAVCLFLTLPIFILVLRLISDVFPQFTSWSDSLEKAKFIVPYFTSLTALVFGLAGLNTWDRRMNGHSNGKPVKKDSSEESNGS